MSGNHKRKTRKLRRERKFRSTNDLITLLQKLDIVESWKLRGVWKFVYRFES